MKRQVVDSGVILFSTRVSLADRSLPGWEMRSHIDTIVTRVLNGKDVRQEGISPRPEIDMGWDGMSVPGER